MKTSRCTWAAQGIELTNHPEEEVGLDWSLTATSNHITTIYKKKKNTQSDFFTEVNKTVKASYFEKNK